MRIQLGGRAPKPLSIAVFIAQGCSEAGSTTRMKSLLFLAADSAVPFVVSKKWYQWFKNISYMLFFKKTHINMINSFFGVNVTSLEQGKSKSTVVIRITCC